MLTRPGASALARDGGGRHAENGKMRQAPTTWSLSASEYCDKGDYGAPKRLKCREVASKSERDCKDEDARDGGSNDVKSSWRTQCPGGVMVGMKKR